MRANLVRQQAQDLQRVETDLFVGRAECGSEWPD